MNNFKCKRCGGKKLVYQKFVRCVSEVEIDESSGNIHYEQSLVDEEDYLPVEYGYICIACGEPILYLGNWIRYECDLRNYLTVDPEDLAARETYYQETESASAIIYKQMVEEGLVIETNSEESGIFFEK